MRQMPKTESGRIIKTISPESAAGILLREFDTAEQALRYAERKAAFVRFSHPQSSAEYLSAANAIRAAIEPGLDQQQQ